MDFYRLPFHAFSDHRSWTFNLVEDVDQLNRRIAREAVDAIRQAGEKQRQVMMVTPVGPLDYSYWARLCNAENVSCAPLLSLGMDEYLDEEDKPIAASHPLSFRRYIESSLIENLEPQLRPDPENILFPDPEYPERTTKRIVAHGGADICFGGCGITGHFAFNDPPEPEEPCDNEAVRNSTTRRVTISRESQTQMCMGGSDGDWDIIPKRAVTLGMSELLMSKKIHLTFMRAWHAGVLRRALFGPVVGLCPASFIQDHPHVEVTVTRLAARLPGRNVTQATGEEEGQPGGRPSGWPGSP